MENLNILPKFAQINPVSHSVEYMRNTSPLAEMGAYFDWLNTEYPFTHSHEHWEILLVVEGEIVHTINKHEYVMPAGSVCIIRPKDSHKISRKSKKTNFQYINFLMTEELAQNMLFEFDSAYYEKLKSDTSILSFNITNQTLNHLISKCLKIQNADNKFINDSKIQLKIILHTLFGIFIENRILNYDIYPNWLTNLLFYINSKDSFTESIEQLAKITPYTYSHMAHLFKKHMGMTIIEYRNNIKIDHAKHLLLYSDETMLNISETLGFSSVSHFNHIFKRKEGITPSEFRQQTENI